MGTSGTGKCIFLYDRDIRDFSVRSSGVLGQARGALVYPLIESLETLARNFSRAFLFFQSRSIPHLDGTALVIRFAYFVCCVCFTYMIG